MSSFSVNLNFLHFRKGFIKQKSGIQTHKHVFLKVSYEFNYLAEKP